MSNKLLLDDTGRAIEAAIAEQTKYLKTMVSLQAGESISSFRTIRDLVRAGMGKENFPVGTQIVTKWKDVAANVEYDYIFDVLHNYDKSTASQKLLDADGNELDYALILGSHYATPFGVQFSNVTPLYTATDGLAAGTYNFTSNTSWSKVSVQTYQFTLTQAVPAGGILAFTGGVPICDNAVTSWKISSFANKLTKDPIETVSVTAGTDGTTLATLTGNQKDATSDLYRVGAGYNRYSVSAMREWLNSNAAAGEWYKGENSIALRPNELFTKAGFMSGFSDDFLSNLIKVQVNTATNTISDEGVTDTTKDWFFPASLEQEYCSPQISGVEGDAFDYWKEVLGSKHGQGATVAKHIRYGLENHTSAQYVRLRSAYRGNTYCTWFVDTSGNLYYYYYATYSYRVAPACVIG